MRGSAPLLDRAATAAVLPHRGAMCLIDSVEQWTPQAIRCRSLSHQRQPHPLARADGSLGAACGVEYAAQAMALHAALSTTLGTPPGMAPSTSLSRLPVGMLAGLRALELKVARLDDIGVPLDIEARLESGDPRAAVYAFSVAADGRTLLDGRATVILDATGVLGDANGTAANVDGTGR